MYELVSKIQYKDFEAGEFVESQKRSFEETIDLITKFPWNKQREKIVIDLTNPSITIEGNSKDYLKLGVFFNGKYVLHYFNSEQVLYTKSFQSLEDSFKYWKDFFSPCFAPTDFKKEYTWLMHNLKHFISRRFHYQLSTKSVRKYLLATCGLYLAFSLFIISGNVIVGLKSSDVGLLMIFELPFIVFIGGGIHLIFFFNYYFYAKGKLFIMSKGNDIFYYGDTVSPTMYRKEDIVNITILQPSGRYYLNEFGLCKIELSKGDCLKIPNIIIDTGDLENKLFAYPIIRKNKSSLIKR